MKKMNEKLNCTLDEYYYVYEAVLRQFPPRKNAPRIIAHEQLSPKEYYEWTEEKYALCTSTIIYEYCNLGVTSDLLPYIFYRF